MVFTSYFLIDLFAVLAAIAATVVAYFQWSFQYWKKKNVDYLQPSFPFGNLENPARRSVTLGVFFRHMYENVKAKGWKHCGFYFFAAPRYFVTDLDYLKNILTKDFQHFVDRGTYVNERDDPISAHLFSIGGVKWRNLRTKVTPTFTSGKMKQMFQTLVDCESSLQEVMKSHYERNAAVDIKEVLGCFTTDIIGSCAFGLDCNTFKEDDSPFRRYGKKVFNASKLRLSVTTFAVAFPHFARMLHIRNFPKDISDFFHSIVKETVEYREKNNVSRKDFMQLMIELKNNDLANQHDGKKLTIEEVVAQCFIFFLAGFETSSSTMTFALYELGRHQHIQDKVRNEINEVLAKYNGKITYDSINEMKYMNQVIDEALRKYPPVPFITRECVKDYKVPNQDLVIEQGTQVIIPILGIHYDKDIYPDPEKFDPERFTEENKSARHQYAHIPFGEGPRICIGMRFGLMQSKVGLTSLLRDYRFTINKKTQEPLKMQENSFILAAQGEIWLNAEKIVKNKL